MVAGTALARSGPVVIVTSDVPHLSALVSGHGHVAVVNVERAG
jgi:hypothetical protein